MVPGQKRKTGTFTAGNPAAAVNLDLGFVPDRFQLIGENATDGDIVRVEWLKTMGDGKSLAVYSRDVTGTSAAITEKFITTGGISSWVKSGSAVVVRRWLASQTWAVGDIVTPTKLPSGFTSMPIMKCTTAGAGGATEPATWNTDVGDTTTDNAATWTCIDSGTAPDAAQEFLKGYGVTVPAALQKVSVQYHYIAELGEI